MIAVRATLFFTLLIMPLSMAQDTLPTGLVARGDSLEISENDYYIYVAKLHLKDEIGQSLLQQLISEVAIEKEAERRELEVSQAQLEARIADLDARFRRQYGENKGLERYLRDNHINESDFFAALRLSIAHEIMAREDFEIDEDEAISVEKQNIWLKELLNRTRVKQNGLDQDTLAMIEDQPISHTYFGRRLSSLFSPEDAAKVLTEMIGIRLIMKRAESLDIELTDEDLQRELRDRQAKLKSVQGLKDVSYEAYLNASAGITLEELLAGDKFRCEVLMKKICDSLHHEAYLQDFYEENKAYFNRRFGEAARLSTIYLKSVKFPNQFVSRSHEQAREELLAIKARLERDEVSFENMAQVYSEHETQKSGGDLGFIPPDTKGWEETARAALLAEKGALLGPILSTEGYHLLKVTDKRDNPSYAGIHDEIVREARQRFYSEVLTEAEVSRKF